MNRQNYDDIIGLSRPFSVRHKPMPILSRAAQFAPFAALNGYGSAVCETARLTEEEIEADENRKEILDSRLRGLAAVIESCPEAKFTYFKPDRKKSGGAYVSVVGRVKEIDEVEGKVILSDGTKIPFGRIHGIESGLFDDFC